MSKFADRILQEASDKRSPICVGIDPRPALLPPEILDHARKEHAEEAEALAAAFLAFGRIVVDLVADHAIAVKPQVAFFEPLLGPGYAAYASLCRSARDAGLVVIADVKRGDIGSTAEAYARSWFAPEDGRGPVADAITVNPLFGTDGLTPFIDAAEETGGGLFVLVRTSNPTAAEIQDLMVGDDPVHSRVAALVRGWNDGRVGESGYGPVGAVVGATRPDLLRTLRDRLSDSILLLPGYGAQGAGAADVRGAFDARGRGALVSASRSITFPWASSGSVPSDWKDAIRNAVRTMHRELDEVLGRGH